LALSDDDKGQPRRPSVRVILDLGHLERAENPPPQLECVVDGLQAGRVGSELVVPEVGRPGTRGDDQAVIRRDEVAVDHP
jgi:hypothetical protein